MHIGSFLLPNTTNRYDGTSLGTSPTVSWGNLPRGLAYSRDRGTLYITTGSTGAADFYVSEITIPTIVKSTSRDPNDYQRAQIVPPCFPREIMDGVFPLAAYAELSNFRVRGLTCCRKADLGIGASGEVLIASIEPWYVTGATTLSNYPTVCVLELPHNANLDPRGPYFADGGTTDSTAIGEYAFVPWQDARLGNKQLWHGMGKNQGTATTSHGPAEIGFNLPSVLPAHGATFQTSIAQDFRAPSFGADPHFPVLTGMYPTWGGTGHPTTHGYVFEDEWQVHCFVYTNNYEAMLRICRKGSIQLYCDQGHQPYAPGVFAVGDTCPAPQFPSSGYLESKGHHGQPYQSLMTLTSIDTMAEGIAGIRQPYEVLPYDHQWLNAGGLNGDNFLWQTGEVSWRISGAAYDPDNRRIFLREKSCYLFQSVNRDVIHVLQVDDSPALPPPPPVEQRLRRFRIS